MDTPLAQALEMAEKSGVLQKDIAEKADISPQSLTNYKNGHAQPPLKVAQRLARVLNKSLDELFPAEEDQHGPGGSAG